MTIGNKKTLVEEMIVKHFRVEKRRNKKKWVPLDLTEPENLKQIDPMVRPVAKTLVDKGYDVFASCQGHSKRVNMKFRPAGAKRWILKKTISPPYLVFKSTPALDKRLRDAGFRIEHNITFLCRKQKKLASADIVLKKNRKGKWVNLTMKQRQRLWRKALREVNKLRDNN